MSTGEDARVGLAVRIQLNAQKDETRRGTHALVRMEGKTQTPEHFSSNDDIDRALRGVPRGESDEIVQVSEWVSERLYLRRVTHESIFGYW